MLVASVVLPLGPASKCDTPLDEGDILVSVNGRIITKFVGWESLLDDGIGKEIVVVVERGGEQLTAHITVQDLHSMYRYCI